MAKTPLKIVVSGCCGRMGMLIIEEIVKEPAHFTLVGALEHPGHPRIGQPLPAKPNLKVGDNLPALLLKADLLIEFTTPEATLLHAKDAAEAGVAMIIGTTGLTSQQIDQLRSQIHGKIPVFISPNMSMGIFVLRKTVGDISKRLSRCGIPVHMKLSETHHAKKKDRPSGTAKQLAKDVQEATGQVIPDDKISVTRDENYDVVGIHAVSFEIGAERITLEHEALDRRVFAQGALVAAKAFLKIDRKPGWYTMDDLVQ